MRRNSESRRPRGAGSRRKEATGTTPPTSSSAPVDQATAYARAVAAGKIVAGPHVRDACARHLRDLKDGRSRGLVWDVDAAERAIRFFRVVLKVKTRDNRWVPFALEPSQCFIVGSIFGWKRADSGYRRFRVAYVEEGKGNGKSPLAAGIGLYMLAADGEEQAEVYAAASKKDQAYVVFRHATAMYQKSPALQARLLANGVNPIWQLNHVPSGSFFRPISSEDGQSGPLPHCSIVDEMHEHKDRYVVDQLDQGQKGRVQPLLFIITNSGFDRGSVCYEYHDYAEDVAAGEIEDDEFFSYVCALDEKDDPFDDPACWVKANPLLGVSIGEDYLSRRVSRAKAIPARRNLVSRLNFCIWTDSENGWLPREAWEACEDPSLKLSDFEGQDVWGGLDLGAVNDLTGKALVFRDGETGDGRPKFALFAHGYTPQDTLIERSRRDKAHYDVWVREGHLTATPGAIVRLPFVAQGFADDAARFRFRALAYDVWLFRYFEDELDAIGLELPVIEHPQGFNARQASDLRMPDSINAFEELVLDRRLRIAVNPALRTAVRAVQMVPSPAGLRRFTKAKSTGRIDLAVAATMAVGAATAKTGGSKMDLDVYLANPVLV